MRYSLFTLLVLFISSSFSSEPNTRIRVDFTIKQKIENRISLEIGTAYYDKLKNQLVYQLTFPNRNILVTTDTAVFTYSDDSLINTSFQPGIIQRSIFHLMLTSNLKSFGLGKGLFKTIKVEKQDSLVVTTYKSDNNKVFDGTILVSNHKNKLHAVVYKDASGNVVSKQFYEKYTTVDGLEIPTRIVFIVFENGKEYYKTIEFSNIVLNEEHNNHMYHYPAGH
ncbi:MAG: DUF4292 domain-containing protein [Bacteroidetes bacterium]|nr:DUF4292 domain-containing protein [Bacteroidota bacterium]